MVVIADSGTSSMAPNYYFNPTKGSEASVTLVHTGQANCGFYDGHVTSFNPQNGNADTETAMRYYRTPSGVPIVISDRFN